MIIPSIDLMNGKVVQLVQGKEKALEIKEDPVKFAERFAACKEVQVIDLDAAKGQGSNAALVEGICKKVNARVGGGIRSIEMAEKLVGAGAKKAIIGTMANKEFLNNLGEKIGRERIIVALDSFNKKVAIKGWEQQINLDPIKMAKELEPYCSEFLVTVIEREGKMQGTDIEFLRKFKGATKNRVVAAGGISSAKEVKELEKYGIDAVVGMALYAGKIKIEGVRIG